MLTQQLKETLNGIAANKPKRTTPGNEAIRNALDSGAGCPAPIRAV